MYYACVNTVLTTTPLYGEAGQEANVGEANNDGDDTANAAPLGGNVPIMVGAIAGAALLAGIVFIIARRCKYL